MRAWARDTRGSSTRISAVSSRPTSIGDDTRGNSTRSPSLFSHPSRAGAVALDLLPQVHHHLVVEERRIVERDLLRRLAEHDLDRARRPRALHVERDLVLRLLRLDEGQQLGGLLYRMTVGGVDHLPRLQAGL